MPISKRTFYAAYEQALDEEYAALFVGAGLSLPAGFATWKELLREIAAELNLDIDEETDLISVAQYHVNQTRNRVGLNRKLLQEFTRNAELTENHRLIATLPIACVWTTNYDHLLETAFAEVRKRVDRKVTQADLANTRPRRDVVIHKMHGDIDHPDHAVLTKADYERYSETRALFSVQLRGDLVSKTFLFLGFSFTDPNISYVLGRVRSLVGENGREHYWVTLNAECAPGATKRDRVLQRHRIEDLKTYGVRTLLIDDYAEIGELLSELNRRAHRKNVFVSGSAVDYGPLGEARVRGLLRQLASALIVGDLNVVSGMGYGVGDAVALGAIEAVYRRPGEHVDERILLRPFPQAAARADHAALWARYRREMLSRAGTVVFVLGNKLGAAGEVAPAAGVLEEFTAARELGLRVIPVGVTGHVARELWHEVSSRLGEYFGPLADTVAPHIATLGDPSADDRALVGAILAIAKAEAPV